MFKAGDAVVAKYLQLLARSKALDEERAALSKECSEARVDVNNLFAKFRYYVRNGWRGFENKRALDDETFGGLNGSNFGKALIGLDDGCVMDKKTKIERYLQRKESLRNVATVVGVLGASIAFTTLFSANRGRLDLIAWSFTSFIFVVFVNAVPMLLPSHETDLLARGEYFIASQFDLRDDFFFIVVPLLLGVILLVSAVALLDPSSPVPVPGSATAIRVAGYMALGALMNIALLACMSYGKTILNYSTSTLLNPRGRAHGNSKGKLYPSHLLLKDPSTRWSFLPGGENFFEYRQWRRSQVSMLNADDGRATSMT